MINFSSFVDPLKELTLTTSFKVGHDNQLKFISG